MKRMFLLLAVCSMFTFAACGFEEAGNQDAKLTTKQKSVTGGLSTPDSGMTKEECAENCASYFKGCIERCDDKYPKKRRYKKAIAACKTDCVLQLNFCKQTCDELGEDLPK